MCQIVVGISPVILIAARYALYIYLYFLQNHSTLQGCPWTGWSRSHTLESELICHIMLASLKYTWVPNLSDGTFQLVEREVGLAAVLGLCRRIFCI